MTIVSGQAQPDSIAANGSLLFWLNEFVADPIGESAPSSGSVESYSPMSQTHTQIAHGLNHPKGLAVDDSSVYLATTGSEDALHNGLPDGLLLRLPVGGGTISTLATGLSRPSAVAIDADRVYWADDDTVFAVSKGGGLVSTLMSGANRPAALFVDSHGLVIGGGNIIQISLTGGMQRTLADEVDSGSFAVDLENVYWSDRKLGRILRVSRAGGAPVVLDNNAGIAGLFVDGTALFWYTGNGVVRLDPK